MQERRHKRYQIGLTAGLIVSTLGSVLLPDVSTHWVQAGLLVNIMWIWEN